MKKSYLKIGMFLVIGTILVLQLSGCRNKDKDFYGYWSGTEDGLPIAYDFKITKDKVIELKENDELVDYKYTLKHEKINTGSYSVIKISKDELVKGIPEIEQTTGESKVSIMRMEGEKDKLMLMATLNGKLSTAVLYRTSKDKSPIGKIEKENDIISKQTTDEKIDSFIKTYTAIPPTWKLVNEDKGITINTDTEISTDAQSLSDLLANLTGISNAVTEQVGKDIPLRLLENGKKDYSVVFKNGQVTDYNEVFKKVIE
ncbi:TPA: hypothetical protein ACIEC3_001618 [Enterococcus faecium]